MSKSWTVKNLLKSNRKSRSPFQRRLAVEGLEPRLVLTWAAIPPAQVTLPAIAISVTLDSQGDATGAGSVVSNEVDYFKFTANATGAYEISTATPKSSLDTMLGVFSSTGQRLSYNDDIQYAVNTDSDLTVNLAAGATYYIGITNYSILSRGAYDWSIDGPSGTTTPGADDSYEENDVQTAAADLGSLTAAKTVTGLVMADGADWFRFSTTLTGGSTNKVSIAFQNGQGDLQLQLYNAAGTLIGTSQGTGDGESVSLSGRAAGTYFVRVFGADNPSYSLTVAPPIPITPPAAGFQITLNMTGLTTSQQAIFQQAAARWSEVITGDLPNATYHGMTVDDVLIDASGANIDGVNGILGQAAPDAFRSGSNLPYHGFMQFDNADMASMQASGLLFSVILHEMGHVLGIGTLWQRLGLLSGASTSNPIFTGANATAAYNALAHTNAPGVPVENSGGPGTRLAHWRETTFDNELMTGYAAPGANPLSAMTIASLADIGYTVNMAAADHYSLPSNVTADSQAAAGASTSPSSAAPSRPTTRVAPRDAFLTDYQPTDTPVIPATDGKTAGGTIGSTTGSGSNNAIDQALSTWAACAADLSFA